VIILPLFGGIEYKDNLGNSEFLGIEQIRIITAEAEMPFEVFNPYENENVSYLQIDFQKDKQSENYFQQSEVDFTVRNKLSPLFEVEKAIGFIGLYDGRKEDSYTLKKPENGIFVFVINGAFEVENRLLEAKDGLSMSEVDKIEWEALSENAVLLVFEVPLK
jgi:redox-sensitive bicupin YhaK (pirin superfamily)